jgi:hypothetical protein
MPLGGASLCSSIAFASYHPPTQGSSSVKKFGAPELRRCLSADIITAANESLDGIISRKRGADYPREEACSMDIAARRENTMTDFQFRSIIKMVLKIVKSSKDTTEIIQALEDLLDTKDTDKE